MENSNYAGHLHILETEEIAHIYAMPDFTPDERAVFFMLTTPEILIIIRFVGYFFGNNS